MKKLLYITVNSKPESLSSSKTVGRVFVNKFLEKNSDFQLEELDLYKCHIPRLEYQYFEKRNCMINEQDLKKLSPKEQDEVHKIVKLTDQFKDADMYVIAAPMWSLSFPAPLKEYIDCIVMDKKTIEIGNGKPKPLLDDKFRGMVYIQSSGGAMPMIIEMFINKGISYVKEIMKLMGIRNFKELLVDSTGTTQQEKENAENEAISKIDDLIDEIWPTTNKK